MAGVRWSLRALGRAGALAGVEQVLERQRAAAAAVEEACARLTTPEGPAQAPAA